MNKPKRNHHVLPRLYLNGFIIHEGEPFIWVYKRGELFDPGLGKITKNPYKDSINNVAVERDFYAHPTQKDKAGFETVENKLEKLEKPADPILRKLRQQQPITEKEKHDFSIYIIQMHRRVKAGREQSNQLLPKLIDHYEPPEEAYQKLKLPKTPETRFILKELSREISAKKGFDIHMHLGATIMVEESFLVETLQKMEWHFYIAPSGHRFLTGDNPVFIPTDFGLNKNISELSFPISSNVAMVASWYKLDGGVFSEAPPKILKELNRRTAHKALLNLYFSRPEKWIVTLLNSKSYKYRPIYSATSVFPVVKLMLDKKGGKPRLVFNSNPSHT